MGLEPTRPIGHKILSLACLPISALPRDKVYISTAEGSWQQLFSFFVLFLGLFLFPSMKGVRPHHGTTMGMLYLRWGQTPRPPGSLWHGLGSDPIMAPVLGHFIYDGVRPPGLLGRWSDPNGLPLIFFGFRRGRLRVLRGELCLAGLDVLLNGLLRAFVDGTALLTAEGLHQAYVVGV